MVIGCNWEDEADKGGVVRSPAISVFRFIGASSLVHGLRLSVLGLNFVSDEDDDLGGLGGAPARGLVGCFDLCPDLVD